MMSRAKSTGKTRRKPGPKKKRSDRHRPTDYLRGQVNAYAAVGTPQVDIATALGLSTKLLDKHYRKELDTALIVANAKVGATLYKKATSDALTAPAVAAIVWWEKTRGGRKETTVNEHGGIDGKPINVVITADDAKL